MRFDASGALLQTNSQNYIVLEGSLGEGTLRNVVPLPNGKLIIPATGSYWSSSYRLVSDDLSDYSSATVTPPTGGGIADTALVPSRTAGREGYIFLTIDSPYEPEASYSGTEDVDPVRYD